MAPKISLVLLLLAAVGQVRGDDPPAGELIPNATAIISGVVPCGSGSNIDAAAVPPFADATVQAICDNSVVGTATTDDAGAFAINLGPLSPAMVGAVLYPVLRNQCSVAVTTPLATCNASLGGGTLTTPLQFQQQAARRTVDTDGFFDKLAVVGGILGGFFDNLPAVGGLLGIVSGGFSSA